MKKSFSFRNWLCSFLLLMVCQEVFLIFVYTSITSFFIYCNVRFSLSYKYLPEVSQFINSNVNKMSKSQREWSRLVFRWVMHLGRFTKGQRSQQYVVFFKLRHRQHNKNVHFVLFICIIFVRKTFSSSKSMMMNKFVIDFFSCISHRFWDKNANWEFFRQVQL